MKRHLTPRWHVTVIRFIQGQPIVKIVTAESYEDAEVCEIAWEGRDSHCLEVYISGPHYYRLPLPKKPPADNPVDDWAYKLFRAGFNA